MAAIITGSDSGIGCATAVALAQRGHDIGVTFSRDEEGGLATAEEVRSFGWQAVVRHLDQADPGSVQPVIEELSRSLGGLDVLVNGAGSGRIHAIPRGVA